MLFLPGLSSGAIFFFPLRSCWPLADPVLAVVHFHIAKVAASTLENKAFRKVINQLQRFCTELCQGRFPARVLLCFTLAKFRRQLPMNLVSEILLSFN